MALNIFKKAKDEPKKEAPKKEKGGAEVTEKEAVKTAPLLSGGSNLVQPHITEKATLLAEHNQYVFVVKPTATKKEIEKDVSVKYGVDVVDSRIINVKPKKIRLGRTQGLKKGYKKVIVEIKEGQRIEILPT